MRVRWEGRGEVRGIKGGDTFLEPLTTGVGRDKRDGLEQTVAR